MASTKIYRSLAANGQEKGTISLWCKGDGLNAANQVLLCNWGDANNHAAVLWNSSSNFDIFDYQSGYVSQIKPNGVFRDPAAWYHLVYTWDAPNGTENQRNRVWINGIEQTYSTSSYYGASDNPAWNKDYTLNIGSRDGTDNYFSGSMSHVYFIQGYTYEADTFGQFDATSGIWKIKTSPTINYTGTGTNSCFLKMEDRTNLDLDSGGNTLTFTTAGTLTPTYDNPSDNFATLNPLHESDPSGNYVLSNGNTTLTVTSNDYQRQVGVTVLPAGLKGYFEWKAVDDSNYQQGFQVTSIKLGKTNYDTAATGDIYFLTGDPMRISYSNGGSAATWIASYFPTWAEGDIMGCAFDFTGTNRNVWFHRNGTYGNNGSGVGDPAAGTYPAMTSTQLPVTKEFEITHAANSGTTSVTSFNFGNGYFGTTAIASAGTNASGIGTFEYDVPTGFTALSTKGLNE